MPSFRVPAKRALFPCALLATALLAGCGAQTSWAKRTTTPQGPLPAEITVMVTQTSEFQDRDVGNWASTATFALQYELSVRGIAVNVVELAGQPRLPRIELAFRTLDYSETEGEPSSTTRPARMVVDCALVSAKDEIQFVGRIVGTAPSTDIEPLAKAVGAAIADELSDG